VAYLAAKTRQAVNGRMDELLARTQYLEALLADAKTRPAERPRYDPGPV
jgi:hypothetical protein